MCVRGARSHSVKKCIGQNHHAPSVPGFAFSLGAFRMDAPSEQQLLSPEVGPDRCFSFLRSCLLNVPMIFRLRVKAGEVVNHSGRDAD